MRRHNVEEEDSEWSNYMIRKVRSVDKTLTEKKKIVRANHPDK